MARGDPELKLRLPTALLVAIQAEAKANCRSMNSEVVLRLCTSLGITPLDVQDDAGPSMVTAIRAPIDLLNETKAAAAKNGCSFNRQVTIFLRSALAIEGADR